MAKKRVLVITDRADAHVRFVEKHLHEPFIVLDTHDLLKGTALTYGLKDGQVTVEYDGQTLDDVAGVWFRKPSVINTDEIPVSSDYKEYSQTAMQRHAGLLVSAFQDATWVSDFYAILRASDKTLQMAEAERLGFNVPDTIITSDPVAVGTFIKKHPVCITKPLTNTHPKVGADQKLFFSTIVDKNFVPDLSGLYLAPAIFQQAIEPAYDIRAVVVGDQVFAGKVWTDEEGKSEDNIRVRDVRLGHYGGKVHIEKLPDFPKEVTDKCVAHAKALGLSFSAIDLVVDKKGKHWFLENNPNGQWAYVEKDTGLPIGKAIADLLQGK
jgi:glutathione synthase/RimK-type ligase-like ATP-grasp enzyme